MAEEEGGLCSQDRGRAPGVGFALSDYNPLFRFSLTLCVRLEAIEAIKNRSLETPEKYRDGTVSSLTQLEFLDLPAEPGGGVKWEAQSEAQLAEVLGSVSTLVAQRVMPFFDEYRDAAALNRGLNPPGAENVREVTSDRRTFDASNPPYRFMSGVIAAHLVGDPRRDALVAAYRAQTEQLGANSRLRFEKLVADLLGGPL